MPFWDIGARRPVGSQATPVLRFSQPHSFLHHWKWNPKCPMGSVHSHSHSIDGFRCPDLPFRCCSDGYSCLNFNNTITTKHHNITSTNVTSDPVITCTVYHNRQMKPYVIASSIVKCNLSLTSQCWSSLG